MTQLLLQMVDLTLHVLCGVLVRLVTLISASITAGVICVHAPFLARGMRSDQDAASFPTLPCQDLTQPWFKSLASAYQHSSQLPTDGANCGDTNCYFGPTGEMNSGPADEKYPCNEFVREWVGLTR